MHIALEDLGLAKLYIVHAGTKSFRLGSRIHALALGRILEDLPRLR